MPLAVASAAARRLSGGAAAATGCAARASYAARAAAVLARPGRAAPPLHASGPGLCQGRYRPPFLARCAATAGHNAAATAAPAVVGPAAAAGIAPDAFVVVNFYHLVDVEDPAKLHAAHAATLSTLDIAGRIYITPQGINAQFSGPAADADAYVAWAAAQPGFAGMTPSAEPAPGGGHLFPRLRLKLKPDLISLAGGCGRLPITDPAARAKPLTPDQWAAMLALAGGGGGRGGAGGGAADASSAPTPIVLDVRNGYEWDAGHFAGAARPLEENFNETPTDVAPPPRLPGGVPAGRAGPRAAPPPPPPPAESESEDDESTTSPASASTPPIPAHLADAPRDAPVMMYCTGGIRCDVYSTHLAAQGFTNLYTLEGGVHRYFREKGGEGWTGSLFVFDARMAVAPDGRTGAGAAAAAEPLPSASSCALCGGPATLPHLNCANVDCNRLFISCRACAAERSGCCCEACMAAPRLLRPAKFSGQYGTWAAEATGGTAGSLAGGRAARDGPSPPPDAVARMASGRGEGRLARRRARAARAAAGRAAGRDERAARKAAARAAVAARGGAEADEEAADERGERLARLAALRERLKTTTGGAPSSSSELVAEWAAPCPACGAPGGAVTRVARLGGSGSDAASTSTVVAADACDACGWRGPVSAWDSGESLGGPGAAASSPLTIRVATPAAAAAPLPPISRSAAVSIPELGLDLAPGSTAVAGAATPAALLAAVRADLGGPRVGGSGGEEGGGGDGWAAFWAKLAAAEALAAPWSLVVSGVEAAPSAED